jgi:hypothetical protein
MRYLNMTFRPSHLIIAMLVASFALAQGVDETPAAAALRIRKEDAEKRALFQSEDTLKVTLEGNFGALARERDPEHAKTYSGVIRTTGPNNEAVEVPVQLTIRGSLRRKTCDFVPLKVAFAKDRAKGTIFEMRGSGVKLVTHCHNTGEDEQYILREYLAYRLGNIVTNRSFRARLAHVTYIDSDKKKTVATRYAIFLEDDDDVARRLEGKIVDDEFRFEQLHPVALLQMSLFEYMIGNTDFSIFARHNVRIVQGPAGLVYPIPYDFDVSGLVNVPYAIPDPRLHIQSLTERVYRGPCRTPEQMEPFLNILRTKKDSVAAAIESVPDMTVTNRHQAEAFLNGFFSLIDKPSRVKHELIDHCLKTAN